MGYSDNYLRIARGGGGGGETESKKQISEEPVCRLAFGNFQQCFSLEAKGRYVQTRDFTAGGRSGSKAPLSVTMLLLA